MTIGFDDRTVVCFRCGRFSPSSFSCAINGRYIYDMAAEAGPFCPIGLHGLRVRYWLRKLDKLVTGSAHIVWFLLHHCRPSLPVLLHRRAACGGCEHNRRFAWLRYCGQCGCWLRAKIGLTYQRCPVGKWEAVKDDACRPPLGLRVLQKGCCNGGR